MAMTMMALGEFRFALATAAYERLVLSQSWRWPKLDRIGRDPALQYVGMEAAEIAMDGVIYPTFKGGLGQIERLRAMADSGKPLLLADGLGRVWGKWVIERIEDTRTLLMDDGQARKIEFRLTLKAYGDDNQSARSWLVPARASSTPMAIAGGAVEGIDDLAEAIDALPEITPELGIDAIAAAGEASASILDRLGAAMGEIAQGMRQTAQAIGALPQKPPAAVALAARDLLAEIEACRLAPIARPAQASGWIDAVRHAAWAVCGHGGIIATAGDLLYDRLTQALADDPRREAQAIAARLAETRRAAHDIAALGQRLREKWP